MELRPDWLQVALTGIPWRGHKSVSVHRIPHSSRAVFGLGILRRFCLHISLNGLCRVGLSKQSLPATMDHRNYPKAPNPSDAWAAASRPQEPGDARSINLDRVHGDQAEQAMMMHMSVDGGLPSGPAIGSRGTGFTVSGGGYQGALPVGTIDIGRDRGQGSQSVLDADLHSHMPLTTSGHTSATIPTANSMQGTMAILPPLVHAHQPSPAPAPAPASAQPSPMTTPGSMSAYTPFSNLGPASILAHRGPFHDTALSEVPGGDATELRAEHNPADGLSRPMAGPGAGPAPSAPASTSSSELGRTLSAGGADRAAETPSAPSSAVAKQIRRRMRMITSCLECRRRKLKCDKSQPCSNCDKFNRDCLYLGPKMDEVSQLRLTQMKEKVGSLERQLERDVAHNNSPAARQQRILADDVEDEFADDRELEPTDLVAVDLTYEDDADGGMDDLIDLGVAVGRVRITERVSGLPRPAIAEERPKISAGINGKPGPPPIPLPPHLQGPPPDFSAGMSSASWPDFLRPSSSYIPPSSNFFMGQSGNAPSFESLLPTRGAADRLIQQYFDCVHPVARCVHRPTFQLQYAEFWTHVYQNIEPRPSLQALVFAAMFSASISMDEPTANQEFGRTQKSLYETCKLGTESALSKANFLRTTRFETMQAFVLYLLPLCRDEISRAHSVLVGTAVRMAECMGLHRDGETYGLSPLDTHVRRLVWHQLCFLDIRTCEAQGPRPTIRREDYDTKLPLNCDENQLSRTGPPPRPVDHWTSTLLTLIRFEITEMMRIIWVDRRKLEAKQLTLTAVLTKIENFRKRMFEKYERYLNDSVPLQRYAKLVMNLFLYRLHAMTLHAFHTTATGQLPPRLNSVLITSGIMIIEIGIQLERNPMFYPWAWYSGAYHQFQIAMLLASEVYYNPQTRQADRIWGCLDYVFDTDRQLPPEVKGLQILGEIVYKTTMYQRMRKSKPPIHTPLMNPIRKASSSSSSHNQSQNQPIGSSDIPVRSQSMQAQNSDLNFASLPISHMIDPQPIAIPPSDTFAGVSDGQTLWSVPDPNQTPNNAGHYIASEEAGQTSVAPATQESLGIDWDVINNLFTNDPTTGDLSISGYSDPALTIDWEQCT
ncbi:fungal specific transcription factor domain-containing protein [Paramyrothecium foliicola]|nr:fungal specific transcription factor domain-containing protein [Paramyrothecium foliicola]